VASRLQVPEQVARGLRALVALVAGALVAVVLRPQDLIRVLDAPPHEPHRRPVGQEARVEREVDGKRQGVGNPRQQRELCGGEDPALGQRADHELRLPADPELRLDAQPPPVMVDVAVAPAQDVGLHRREHGLAVALEDERLRLVQAVDLGLAEAAAERPAYQPLELDRAGRAHVEVGG
jgi:hypothetical protein